MGGLAGQAAPGPILLCQGRTHVISSWHPKAIQFLKPPNSYSSHDSLILNTPQSPNRDSGGLAFIKIPGLRELGFPRGLQLLTAVDNQVDLSTEMPFAMICLTYENLIPISVSQTSPATKGNNCPSVPRLLVSLPISEEDVRALKSNSPWGEGLPALGLASGGYRSHRYCLDTRQTWSIQQREGKWHEEGGVQAQSCAWAVKQGGCAMLRPQPGQQCI